MSQEQYASTMQAFENAVLETLEKQARAENKKLSPAFRRFLAEFTAQYASYETVCAWEAEFYASMFTAAEPREMAAYQRTEIYRKQVSLIPEMFQRQARWIQQVLEDHREEIKAKIAQAERDARLN